MAAAVDPTIDYNAKSFIRRTGPSPVYDPTYGTSMTNPYQAAPVDPTYGTSVQNPYGRATAPLPPVTGGNAAGMTIMNTNYGHPDQGGSGSGGGGPTMDPGAKPGGLSWLRGIGDTTNMPSGIAGMGAGATPAEVAQAADYGQKMAAAQQQAAATPGASGAATVPTVSTADNISQSNLAAVNQLGAPLAPGVSRYALGGGASVDPSDATRIYTTRGANGEPVFTDNANYAASVSTGGLRRGDVNNAVYDNSQQSVNNPRAGFQYATSDLGSQGLTPDKLSNLDPASAQQAQAYATAGANTNTDQGVSNLMDANLLRSRNVGGSPSFGNAQQPGANVFGGTGVGGAGAGGMPSGIGNLPVQTQTQVFSALQRAQAAADRNKTQAGELAVQQGRAAVEKGQSDQKMADDAVNQFGNQEKTDPNQAAIDLSNRLETDPDKLKAQLATPAGRELAATLLSMVAQPGASASLNPWEVGARTAVPQTRWQDLALDPKTGAFNGFKEPGSGDTVDNPEYPVQRGLGRRLVAAFTPGDSVLRSANYGPGINNLSPQQLQILKNSGQ